MLPAVMLSEFRLSNHDITAMMTGERHIITHRRAVAHDNTSASKNTANPCTIRRLGSEVELVSFPSTPKIWVVLLYPRCNDFKSDFRVQSCCSATAYDTWRMLLVSQCFTAASAVLGWQEGCKAQSPRSQTHICVNSSPSSSQKRNFVVKSIIEPGISA